MGRRKIQVMVLVVEEVEREEGRWERDERS